MSEENQKLGYCVTCDMNVPHWRGKAKGLQKVVYDLMQKVHLGRWHCLRCEKTRYFLRNVNDDAVDYRIDDLNDLLGPYTTDWSPSADDGELNSDCDLAMLLAEQDQQSIGGDVQKTLFAETGKEARRKQQSASEKVTVAEPVGNFIKEKSLAANATRLKRFTEKYRDALVDRILSGKARMSWLIADGKFTEAELVSWIADKEKRDSIDENETIELDTISQKPDIDLS